MISHLFIDNFRGFTNAFIPLLDVNFFVGENSSGKTSVLSLLKLLSTREFSWALKFAHPEVNFGHFHDMVSAHSEDRSYFSFGAIEDSPVGPGATGMMYTFKEHEGLARLSDFSTIVGPRQIHLKFDGTRVYFKTEQYREGLTADEIKNMMMPKWAAERFSDATRYTPTATLPNYPNIYQFALYLPLMMAIEQSDDKDSSGRDVDITQFIQHRQELVWIAPIRTQPERTYDDISQSDFSSDGTHTPYLIRRILQSESEAKKFDVSIRRAGRSSGLFESIQINKYGDAVTAPFEVDAVLDGTPLSLINVGYGVSQSLPVFVEILTRPKGSWFAIQQPEVHLHPRAQAALGDAFFDMATRDGKRFLIETHSDFTIDRFRMNYRKKRTNKEPSKAPKLPKSQILFFERRNKLNTVTPLPIGGDGELPAEQPESYRDFFVKEQLDLLNL